jgi:energy-coupling factor transporter ATP-binding protein EcfA2
MPSQPHCLESSVWRNGSALLPTATVALTTGLNLVTGDNGSGKSSLLLALAGPEDLLTKYRLSPDIIEFRRNFSERRFLPQDTRLQVIGPTLGNDIEITSLLRGVPCRDFQADMSSVWEALPNFLSRKVGAVSRGELQRFVLAQASSRSPPVLALDEPDGFLDKAGMDKLVETVVRAVGEDERAILLIATHRRSEWERRLTGMDWNHVVLPERTLAARYSPELPDDNVIPSDFRLRKGMRVKVGRRTRHLRKDLELSGHRGTIVTGQNGSGKTSLLRAIANERNISRDCRFVPDWSADVGDVRTAGELRLDPAFQGFFDDQRIEPSRPIAYCSWGQRRLLSMFEALSVARPYYIFDEPFAGLSESMQGMMARTFSQKIVRGSHVILSSNRADDPSDAMAGFDRIAVTEYLE